MENFFPEELIVEHGSESSPIYANLRRTLPQVPVKIVDDLGRGAGSNSAHGDRFGAAKKKLYLSRHKGDFLKKCPGSEGQVCCNYFVINFARNCPMDCSYCYLQEYLLDNASLKVFSNLDNLIDEADRMLQRHRGVFFRIGTGEITDSLALEPYTGMVRELIPYFAEQSNVLLELKTKSNCVDSILDLDPKGRIVVAWSMNPQPVIDLDEHGTATFNERMIAARRCQDAGYRLGFHFDPMIEYAGWEKDYQSMVEQMFATIDWRQISWLSLGVLRETPGLKRMMRQRLLFSAATRRDVPQDGQMDSPFCADGQDLSLHGVEGSVATSFRLCSSLRKGARQSDGAGRRILTNDKQGQRHRRV